MAFMVNHFLGSTRDPLPPLLYKRQALIPAFLLELYKITDARCCCINLESLPVLHGKLLLTLRALVEYTAVLLDYILLVAHVVLLYQIRFSTSLLSSYLQLY